MTGEKADIIAQLQKDIVPLQGFRIRLNNAIIDVGLGPIRHAFPNASFPIGAIHEFIYNGVEENAVATSGFVAALVASLMQGSSPSIWITSSQLIFPPALRSFGIAPDKIIFIDLKKEKDILWTMEEVLKCEGISAVVGEIKELSFMTSRRLQLAVEQSRVTGFVLRNNPRTVNTTASVTRWKITPLPSDFGDAMPGVGFPRWNVELLKVRNGKPGAWRIEFAAGRFRHIPQITAIPIPVEQQKKAG